MNERKLQILISLLSGMCVGGCLILTELGWAVFFVASAALCILQKNQADKKVWHFAAAFSLAVCGVAYFPAFFIRLDMQLWVELLIDTAVFCVISLFHSSVLTLALVVALKLPAKPPLRPFFIAIFWTAAELLLGMGAFAWPTARVSLAIWRLPFLIGSARIGGQLFVSFVIMLINALLGLAIINIKSRRAIATVLSALLVFSVNVGVYFALPETRCEHMRVALVQPGFTVIGEQSDIVDRSLELAKEAAKQDIDAVVLPESVLGSRFINDTELFDEWQSIALQNDIDLYVGGRQDGHSAVFHFSPDGEYETYQKIREVPIFENGEGGRKFRLFAEDRNGMMTWEKGEIGALICYESMFPSMTREMAKKGADMFIVQTNDSWFDTQVAKNIHLAHGVFRAVETGRSLVQAGMNGRTAAINGRGYVKAISSDEKADIIYTDVPLSEADTPYLTIGEAWLYAAVFAALLFSTATFIYNRKKRIK